jgi:hypothetical protein
MRTLERYRRPETPKVYVLPSTSRAYTTPETASGHQLTR